MTAVSGFDLPQIAPAPSPTIQPVSQLILSGTLYADRPATPEVGTIVCFTDSTVTAWQAPIITGGGGNKVLGWFNGINWLVFG
jgi:hypothetical protein